MHILWNYSDIVINIEAVIIITNKQTMEKDEESQLVCRQSPQLSVSELATPPDDKAAPIPPAQIAASYERIDDIEAKGKPEVKSMIEKILLLFHQPRLILK